MIKIDPLFSASGGSKGEFVSDAEILISEKISHKKYAALYNGKNFILISDDPLKKGVLFKGRVYIKGKTIHICGSSEKKSGVVLSPPSYLCAGKSDDAGLSSFFEAAGADFQGKLENVSDFIKKRVKKSFFSAGLFALAASKGMIFTEESLSAFFSAADPPFQKKERDREKNKKRKNIKEIADALKKSSVSEPGDPVFLFNHLKDKKGNHIVIPYDMRIKEERIAGNILAALSEENSVKKVLVTAETEKRRWSFFLSSAGGKGGFLRIGCSDPSMEPLITKNLHMISERFEESGIKIAEDIDCSSNIEKVFFTGKLSVDMKA